MKFDTINLIISLLLSTLTWQRVSSATKDDYYNLFNWLFSNTTFYKKEIRPADSADKPLSVLLNFNLLSIVDVNEKQQMLETSARLQMLWDDDYLEWNSTDYGGIEQLLVPQKIVYVPDIVLANSIAAQVRLGYDHLPIRLYADGTINWEPTVHLATQCDLDITYFPFETQLCTIDFETAVSKNTEIDIDVYTGKSAIELWDFTKNGQWELVETSAENLSDEDSKTKIRFSVLIKRRRTFYILNILLPVFFLSLTASLVFALPAEEGEKMGTGITILLAFAVYLTIVSDLIPNTSLQISILGLYLTILLGLSALSVVICAANLRLHHRDPEKPVGPFTTKFTRFFQYVFCIKDSVHTPSNKVSASRTNMDDNNSQASAEGGIELKTTEQQQNEDDSQEPMTWQTVAVTLDWLCFILFTLATIFITLFCLFYLFFGSAADAPSL